MNFLYLLCHVPFFFMVKVGITKNIRQRQASIDRSLRFGKTIYICSIKVPFARKWEKTIHRLFVWCRSSWLGGSGKTEWFFLFPAVVMVPIVIVVRLFWWILIGTALLFGYKFLQ